MQAAALQQYLAHELARDVTIIDYWPEERVRDQEVCTYMPNKDLLEAHRSRLRLSCSTTSAREAAAWMNEHCAAAVFGSDEIWRFPHANRPSGVKLAVPNLYYGQGVNVPRFAYAVSISDSDISTLDAAARAGIAAELERFSFIGVRDEKTARFVRDISPSLAELVRFVPDPTFAMDLDLESRETVRERLRACGIDPGRPIAVVVPNTRGSLPRGEIQPLLDEGFQVISTYWNGDVLHAESLRLDARGWFSLIAAADFVVTQRMHGLVAALLGNVPCLPVRGRQKVQYMTEAFGLPTGDIPDIRRQWPHARVVAVRQAYRDLHREAAAYLRDAIA